MQLHSAHWAMLERMCIVETMLLLALPVLFEQSYA